MRYLETDGVRISAIGLGTWQFGSREWGYGAGYAAYDAPALVRRALELGVTLIDTAEVYAFGESERIVARGLAAAGPDLGAGGDEDAETQRAEGVAGAVPVNESHRQPVVGHPLGEGEAEHQQPDQQGPPFPPGPQRLRRGAHLALFQDRDG